MHVSLGEWGRQPATAAILLHRDLSQQTGTPGPGAQAWTQRSDGPRRALQHQPPRPARAKLTWVPPPAWEKATHVSLSWATRQSLLGVGSPFHTQGWPDAPPSSQAQATPGPIVLCPFRPSQTNMGSSSGIGGGRHVSLGERRRQPCLAPQLYLVACPAPPHPTAPPPLPRFQVGSHLRPRMAEARVLTPSCLPRPPQTSIN